MAEQDRDDRTTPFSGSRLLTATEWRHMAWKLSLSPREIEIVRTVFDDEKEVAIASRLQISPHTVHTYLERIYRKLAVKSRLQMVVRVMGEYLLHSPAAPGPIERAKRPTAKRAVEGSVAGPVDY